MRKNIELLICSLLIVLVFSEIYLRIHLSKPQLIDLPKTSWVKMPENIWIEYHPILGWFHQKNKGAILKKGNLSVELHTNSSGFRGVREYQKNKPESITRILVLGDSFSFGWGVEDRQTFAAKLEERFIRQLEVQNMGVAGYGIDQMALSFNAIGKEYHPDYVIISIYPEGFWRATRSFTDTGYAKPYFYLSKKRELVLKNVPVPQPFELTKNQFPQQIEQTQIESFFNSFALYRLSVKAFNKIRKQMHLMDPDSTIEWTIGRRILKKLVQEIRQNGAKPVLLIVPPNRWIRNSNFEAIHQSLLRFSQSENVDILDLTSDFVLASQASDLTDYYIKDDWHWTDKGHGLVADVLSRYLKLEKKPA